MNTIHNNCRDHEPLCKYDSSMCPCKFIRKSPPTLMMGSFEPLISYEGRKWLCRMSYDQSVSWILAIWKLITLFCSQNHSIGNIQVLMWDVLFPRPQLRKILLNSTYNIYLLATLPYNVFHMNALKVELTIPHYFSLKNKVKHWLKFYSNIYKSNIYFL